MMNEDEGGRGGTQEGSLSEGDTATIDSTVDALYRAISFPPGGRPRWESLRSLFLPGGRVIPPKSEGDPHVAVLSVDEFIARSDELFAAFGLLETGFDERDAHRVTEQFGNAAHVFSTYESRRTPEDAEPFQRGVNSIQLVRDGGRWWAVTIFWDIERDDNPIPERYLSR